jgi:putative transposase
MGGHKPKAIAGEHRSWLLQDFVAELTARAWKVDYRSVWQFVHAES